LGRQAAGEDGLGQEASRLNASQLGPLVERKRVLAALLEEAKSDCFHLMQHLEIEPALVFEQACAMGLEGIVCKLRDGPYRSGNRMTWLKILCVTREVFPIVGFVAARDGIAALHLGRRRGKELAHVGQDRGQMREAGAVRHHPVLRRHAAGIVPPATSRSGHTVPLAAPSV
jgi:bifunctional non-homologous end joining protein LigD